MKIMQICSPQNSFKSSIKYLYPESYGSYSVSDRPNYNSGFHFGDYDSRADFAVKMSMRPNSTYEKTIGNFHEKRYYNIYYADPLEHIDDEKRRAYDYIVYDNEPKYPHPDDISKNYFHDEIHDYGKDFVEIRDYYYRLEMADRKTLAEYENNKSGELSAEQLNEKIAYYKKRIEQSQYQQWQAQECLNKYNAAGDLISKKTEASNNIRYMESALQGNNYNVENCKNEIAKVTTERNDRIKEQTFFINRRRSYEKIIRSNNELAKMYRTKDAFFFDKYESEIEIKFANKQINRLNIIINNLQQGINSTKEELKKLEDKLADFLKQPKEFPAKLDARKAELADIKAKLIPLFDDLKLFYIARKILG